MSDTALPPLAFPVQFADLAARHPDWYPDDPVPLERKPCPVCGHPTGDCATDDILEERMATSARSPHAATVSEAVVATAPGPDEARRVNQGPHPTAEEAMAASLERHGDPRDLSGFVTIEEDVYEAFVLPGPVESSRLKYHRGQLVPRAEYDAHLAGLEKEARPRPETKEMPRPDNKGR